MAKKVNNKQQRIEELTRLAVGRLHEPLTQQPERVQIVGLVENAMCRKRGIPKDDLEDLLKKVEEFRRWRVEESGMNFFYATIAGDEDPLAGAMRCIAFDELCMAKQMFQACVEGELDWEGVLDGDELSELMQLTHSNN
jgi:hypothetical protein